LIHDGWFYIRVIDLDRILTFFEKNKIKVGIRLIHVSLVVEWLLEVI
jgi:hypothetical protein